jgi:hypothetical protein
VSFLAKSHAISFIGVFFPSKTTYLHDINNTRHRGIDRYGTSEEFNPQVRTKNKVSPEYLYKSGEDKEGASENAPPLAGRGSVHPITSDVISHPDFINSWLDGQDTSLTSLKRNSIGNVLRFLGAQTINDLLDIDEPALEIAAINGPQSRESLGFSILDVSKLRALLRRFGNQNVQTKEEKLDKSTAVQRL